MPVYKLSLVAPGLALIAGCATKRDFYAVSGSRADGTVDMAYDVAGPFAEAVIDMNQAESIAARKCSAWGYSDAEPFGGRSERCNQRNGFGQCVAGQVVIQYQCLGDLGAGASKIATPSATRPPQGYRGSQPATTATFGKHQYSAEKAAAAANCNNTTLVNSGPGIELYTAMCGDVPMMVRCEFSNCAVQ